MKTLLKLLPKVLPVFALIPCSVGFPADASKPNIIFVMSDDQRWDTMGAAGNPNIHTPNMDRLAREGVYFPQATITNPQCMCSRAALITGLATHSNGRYSNQSARADILNPHGFDQYECLPEALAKAGYHTANVGKWHMDADPWNVGFAETGIWFPPGSGPYKNVPVARGKSRERTPSEGFLQERFGDSAVEILKKHADSKSTQPIFLWFTTTAPHGPFGPNPEAATAPYEGKEVKDLLPPTYKGNPNHKGVKWHEYYAAITTVDMQLGRIMKTLDETGMSSNTVVVFLGDNGYMMGSRDRQGKAIPYEDSIRVPYVIWGPGVFKGTGKTDAVASSLDLPPTLLKLAGGEVPREWQGRDLTPVLTDARAHGTTWSVSESCDDKNWKFPENNYRTVRTKDSKLIVWAPVHNKAPEFYDLTKDPHEEHNVYGDSAMQPRVKELTAVLENWMKQTDDSWEMRGKVVTQGGPDHGETPDGKKGKRKGKHASDDE
jgi:arylsulfatase A-like enzyme